MLLEPKPIYCMLCPDYLSACLPVGKYMDCELSQTADSRRLLFSVSWLSESRLLLELAESNEVYAIDAQLVLPLGLERA